MNQAAVTETYCDVERLIGMLVDNFHRRYPYAGSRDELLSEANMAFLRAYEQFDPEKARFTTYLYHKVGGTLRRFRNKKLTANGRTMILNDPEIVKEARQKEIKQFDLNLFAKFMTEDAVLVLGLLFESTTDLKETVLTKKRNPSMNRTVKRHLKKMGWAWTRVQSTFAEIRTAIVR